tara:strand:- start:1653 stop:2921 length:1269 start_codon:yes stop_codon:yes gene_type:complete
MTSPSLTYTLTNGTTADASQVMQNFNDLLNGYTDGTKDLSISALTCAGTATLNGHVNLGNASADDLTITASLASSLPIKTTNSYDIGSSTLGLRAAYFGANSQTVNIKGSASMSATWTMTLPVSAGTSGYVLSTDGAGVTSWASYISSSLSQYNVNVGNSSNTAAAVNTNLLGDITGTINSQTATMTIATPGVVTSNSHGMSTGDKFYFTTTGALPTGVSASTTYYASNVATNTFNISTTLANAVAGTYVATSGSQSGTHTLFTGGLKFASSAIPGNSGSSAVTAGYIGEVITASASAVSLTSATAKTITSIVLTPGHWMVTGGLCFDYGGTSTVASIEGGISTTNNTLSQTRPLPDSSGQVGAQFNLQNTIQANDPTITLLPTFPRVAPGATSTLYLVGKTTWTTGSTTTGYGTITAVRIR